MMKKTRGRKSRWTVPLISRRNIAKFASVSELTHYPVQKWFKIESPFFSRFFETSFINVSDVVDDDYKSSSCCLFRFLMSTLRSWSPPSTLPSTWLITRTCERTTCTGTYHAQFLTNVPKFRYFFVASAVVYLVLVYDVVNISLCSKPLN